MSCCDTEAPQAYREARRKARVPHVCYECGARIRRGDFYTYASGVWDGRGDSFDFCLDCPAWAQALLDAQRAAGECPCWPVGSLWHAIEEFCTESLGYRPRDRRRAA